MNKWLKFVLNPIDVETLFHCGYEHPQLSNVYFHGCSAVFVDVGKPSAERGESFESAFWRVYRAAVHYARYLKAGKLKRIYAVWPDSWNPTIHTRNLSKWIDYYWRLAQLGAEVVVPIHRFPYLHEAYMNVWTDAVAGLPSNTLPDGTKCYRDPSHCYSVLRHWALSALNSGFCKFHFLGLVPSMISHAVKIAREIESHPTAITDCETLKFSFDTQSWRTSCPRDCLSSMFKRYPSAVEEKKCCLLEYLAEFRDTLNSCS
ncbi:MAG: hypothetical protein QXU93_11695 [Thermoproteus sp.]